MECVCGKIQKGGASPQLSSTKRRQKNECRTMASSYGLLQIPHVAPQRCRSKSPEATLRTCSTESQTHLSYRNYSDQAKRTTTVYEDFLNSSILPLESIAFQDVGQLNLDALLDIIKARHGIALKHLKLTGTWSKMEGRHITRLYASAPNLETLGLDMHRPLVDSPTWDTPLLSVLASHPSLRHLRPGSPLRS
jgi:hypothetical protein